MSKKQETKINPYVEGAKEIARVAMIAVIPIAITGLETNTLDWRVICVTAIIAILKGLDKFVHKNESMKSNGIIPF